VLPVGLIAVALAARRHSVVILNYSTDQRAKREQLRSDILKILFGALAALAVQYIVRKILH
jgi:uncharacterized membrane protein YciS (DUF1049 family)